MDSRKPSPPADAGNAFELDRLDCGLLALLVLALVPGVRAVAAWPSLWFVPGWFFARRVLGVRGLALGPLAVAFSVAITAFVCLPAAVLCRRLTPLGIQASLAVFALACAHRRVRLALAVPPLAAPPPAFTALLAAFTVLRIGCAIRAVDPPLVTPDDPYFVGMVRSLVTSFPPACAEAAGHRLVQPWGYWLAYAASQVASGCSIAQVLQLVSAVVAVAFTGVLYLTVTTLTGDRLAGALTLPLALGGGGARWLVDSITARALVVDRLGWGGVESPGENVWNGFYDLPALTVLTVALLFASLALRDRSRPAAVVAFGLGALLPFHHPTYFILGALATGCGLLFELGRGRVSWKAMAALAAAPVPFYLLFVELYAANTIPTQPPFFTDALSVAYYADRCAGRFSGVLAYGGLWLPLALVGAWRAPFVPRSFFVGLLGVSLALAVLTDNAAHNGHWTLDPLGVALVVFTASTCAWAVRVRRGWGVALTGAIGVLGVIAGHWERRLPEHLAELAHPQAHATPDQRALAEWLKGHTSETAVLVASGLPSIGAIEGLAERRVYDGFAFHLSLTMPEADVRALERANAEMLADPRSPRLVREEIAFVVHAAPKDSEGARTWRGAAVPVFENAGFVVYAPVR